jgi:cardiolipin synthase
MTVDDAWSLIGSANWDIRSFRLNFELKVEIHDEAFRPHACEADPDGRPLTLRRDQGRSASRSGCATDAARLLEPIL